MKMIELKKFFPTIAIYIISYIFFSWFLNNLSGFTDIIKVIYYLSFLYLGVFILSFLYFNFKNKILFTIVNLFPINLYLLIVSVDLKEFFIPAFYFYLLPLIIILFLSYFLTFLWRKFKKWKTTNNKTLK